ncbi:hypothetical protein [Aquipuribacter hungaricus]|uniref:Uncharacterized protein n=1 Tax=Aquipuribacter hungaricus TaxID=545624 RepID=A0ABV7WL21_9MICO
MQLDTVRNIKQEWLSRVRPSDLDIAPGGGADRAGAPGARVGAVGPVALGAAPAGSGYALAVRYREDGPLVARLVERLRDEVGDGEIDVRGIGPVRPLPTRPTPGQLQGRLRPLVPGCSVCHEADTAGTLGAVVRRGQEQLLLTNAHVIARSGLASAGDAVLQPGPADGGTARDRVGVLDSWVPLEADAANRVDAALARLDAGIEVDPAGQPTTTAELDGDELVEKLGRTTGFTSGRVTAIEVDDVVVDYGEVGLLRFDGQIEVSGTAGAFSRGGDSGSLVRLADGGAAVGLLYAGSERGGPDGTGLTFCNDISTVLDALGVVLSGAR